MASPTVAVDLPTYVEEEVTDLLVILASGKVFEYTLRPGDTWAKTDDGLELHLLSSTPPEHGEFFDLHLAGIFHQDRLQRRRATPANVNGPAAPTP